MEHITAELATAAALLVYIEVRVVRAVDRAVDTLERARGRRRSDLLEHEGPVDEV